MKKTNIFHKTIKKLIDKVIRGSGFPSLKMKNELLLLMKKHKDTLIEQKKPQETLELKMNKQMQTFSFYPPIDLIQEGKWFLAVSSFECRNFVFKITNENNGLSVSISGRWKIPNFLEDGVIFKLKEVLEHREKNDVQLHVKDVRKRGSLKKIGDEEYKLSDIGTQKKRKN